MIDVIIVNYKSSAFLMLCLASIEQSRDRHRPTIFIEDNASDRSIDLVEAVYGTTHIARHRRNFGFAAAVNRALGRSKSPYVMLLNPDTCIDDGLFDTVIEFMEANPDVGVLGPKVLNADGRVQGSARTFPNALTALFGRNSLLTRLFPNNRISRSNILTTRSDGQTPMEVDWVSGACMVVRRSAIERVGPLDERFFMYWEDADWCRRMWQHQQRVLYLPTASVTHRVGGSSAKAASRSILEFHKSAYRLFAKHNPGPTGMFFRVLVFSGLSARYLLVEIVRFAQRLISFTTQTYNAGALADGPQKQSAHRNQRAAPPRSFKIK